MRPKSHGTGKAPLEPNFVTVNQTGEGHKAAANLLTALKEQQQESQEA